MASSILFVCLGNICRSPSAEAVCRARFDAAGLKHVRLDSAGTGDWHVGNPPDPRAIAEGRRRGYDLTSLRARQAVAADFERFDLVLAMDRSNHRNLTALHGAAGGEPLPAPRLFLDFARGHEGLEVPDPYFGDRVGGKDGFAHMFDLIEAAADGLIAEIRGV
ncbi:low molecular weight protein-tyrosine-phosphatase [Cucumibacter marinus]|uniref:low molecular weight protein-tyrosine-phosphatase n=1 Tax=Cucumibacter marinus TaxID=1121252 RepID=UPI00040E1487|nr:low molecular weight protein-tyrosine-phosphatase [Cucumibacter marinus]